MKNYRDQKYLNVNADSFICAPTPYHVYLLGLRWADGHVITKYKRKELRLEMKYDDIATIRHIFDATGKWNTVTRQRDNRSMQIIMSCNNAKLIDYLIVHDYGDKSKLSPIKIINSLQPHELKYFFRGWIDGDGCFYHNKEHGLNQFYLSGTYDQEWSAAERFFTAYNIKYRIIRVITPDGNKYSNIRVIGIQNIKNLFNAVYGNISDDDVYMPRKLLKCYEIINQ